jgi:hypothetical protein
MANFIVQGERLPQGDRTDLIFIDNGDGTFTMTVGANVSTYRSLASAIVAGSGIRVASSALTANLPFVPTPYSIPNAVLKKVFVPSLAATDNDLYTCPASTKALISLPSFYNTTVGSINVFMEHKISGVYNRFGTTIGAGANASTQLSSNANCSVLVLNAGESVAVNAAAIGLNAYLKVFEFPSTVAFKTVRVSGLTNANDNLIYTCPANTIAQIVNANLQNLVQQTLAGTCLIVNTSGVTPTLTSHLIAAGGGAAGATNQVGRVATLANLTTGNLNFPPMMVAGDQIVVTSDNAAAGQVAYVSLFEFPA